MATRKTAKDAKDSPTRARKPVARGKQRRPPTQISERVRERIVEALAVGCYRAHAAAYAGVAKGTFYRWLDIGSADVAAERLTTEHAKLFVAVEEAESEAYFKAVKVLQDAAPKDWRAAEAFLSRRYPGDWSKQTNVGMDLSGSVDHQHTVSAAEPVLPDGVQPSMLPMKLLRQVGDELERRRQAEQSASQN